MLPYKNSEGYADPTFYQALACADMPEFTPRGTVYICSPYAGDVEGNVRIARVLCAVAVDFGYAPLAPHLLLTQFMDDADPKHRRKAFGINKHFLTRCDQVWVYHSVISAGMRQEIHWARQLRLPIRYFNSNFEEVIPC